MSDLNSKTTLLDSGGPSSFGLAVRRSGVRFPSGPQPQHLVSVMPSAGVCRPARASRAACVVSDVITDRVTIRIGCSRFVDAMNIGQADHRCTCLLQAAEGACQVMRPLLRRW